MDDSGAHDPYAVNRLPEWWNIYLLLLGAGSILRNSNVCVDRYESSGRSDVPTGTDCHRPMELHLCESTYKSAFIRADERVPAKRDRTGFAESISQ